MPFFITCQLGLNISNRMQVFYPSIAREEIANIVLQDDRGTDRHGNL